MDIFTVSSNFQKKMMVIKDECDNCVKHFHIKFILAKIYLKNIVLLLTISPVT